mmetsp:Transcript_2513/g.7673  ORF Transcript_2513/g.7673 Transcript_2513/m.7673 type:complete len:287 (+) Transcript_2513:99-959(+)
METPPCSYSAFFLGGISTSKLLALKFTSFVPLRWELLADLDELRCECCRFFPKVCFEASLLDWIGRSGTGGAFFLAGFFEVIVAIVAIVAIVFNLPGAISALVAVIAATFSLSTTRSLAAGGYSLRSANGLRYLMVEFPPPVPSSNSFQTFKPIRFVLAAAAAADCWWRLIFLSCMRCAVSSFPLFSPEISLPCKYPVLLWLLCPLLGLMASCLAVVVWPHASQPLQSLRPICPADPVHLSAVSLMCTSGLAISNVRLPWPRSNREERGPNKPPSLRGDTMSLRSS